jgi:hypothetical protein
MSDLAGWAFYFGVLCLGISSIVLATMWAWRFIRGHGVATLPAVLLVTGAAILAFLGFWIVFDICWLMRAAVRVVLARTRARESQAS